MQTVCVWTVAAEAHELLPEIDEWPRRPKVERDLVDALAALPQTSSIPANPR
jgi:hypothetical protein